ncbi:hypothetical protein A3K64_01510 [Candidatus Micrarchaeota archaeon RBG_16_36_9]|nr:MAG: hypothetical protein A3K64_01510 [Candidatus Micrarchaeota archaeon RBG_16_36_9]
MKLKLSLVFVLVIVVLSIFYYNITLNSPIVFGDEGYYAFHAEKMSSTGVLPKFEYLGTDILHRPFIKPPLFIFVDTFAWLIGGEFGLKLMIPLFSILAAVMIYLFMKRFYSEGAGLVSALIFLLTPALVTYGVLNYVDAFLALIFVAGMYFGYNGLKNNKKKDLILAGIFSALAILTKITGPLLFIALFIYFVLDKKRNFKNIFIIFIIVVLILLPWFLRNILFFGNLCYGPLECNDVIDVNIQKLGLSFEGGLPQEGTNVDILKLGLINFSSFAFGLPIFILLLFGIVNALQKKGDKDTFLLLSLFVFVLIFFLGGGARSEDTARFLVPAVVGISMICGSFIDDLYAAGKKYNKYLSVFGILVILITVSFFGYEKLSGMTQVKQFSKAFFEACSWIKKNTNSTDLIFSIYSHQATYTCDRISTATTPDKEEIQLTNNDTSYQHLKLNGFDYVFVQGFAVSQVAYRDSISISFLNYLSNSQNFKKVFDNTDVYSNGGMLVFKVL